MNLGRHHLPSYYDYSMSMIKIFHGKSKTAKKKPGWKQQEAEYQQWLKNVNSQTLFGASVKAKPKVAKKIEVVVNGPVVAEDRLHKFPSLSTTGGAGTKPVARPEILYKDNPELLKRELKARERKFAIAPAYNKGPAQFVSEDMDADMKNGLLRRR